MSSPDATIFTAVEPHCQPRKQESSSARRSELRDAATYVAQGKLFLARARRDENSGRRAVTMGRLCDAAEHLITGIMVLAHGAEEALPVTEAAVVAPGGVQ